MYRIGEVIGQKNFHYWAMAGIAMELGIPLKTDKYSYDEHEIEDFIRARIRQGKAQKIAIEKVIKDQAKELDELRQDSLFDIAKYAVL